MSALLAPKIETLNGIIDGMTDKEYFAVEAASNSGLKMVNKSPAHFMFAKNNPEDPTPDMILGSAAHKFILERNDALKVYASLPEGLDRRTKEGKATYEAFLKDNAGKTILTAEQMGLAESMAQALRNHPVASRLVRGGQRELATFWTDPETGVLCKCKPDILREDGFIVDVKTTQDASPEGFSRAVAKFRYHVQAAWYLWGVEQFAQVDSFVFIAIEKKAPHAIGVYSLDLGSLEKGRELMRSDLAKYAECVKSGVWPSYPEQIKTLSIPAWAWSAE